MSYQVIARKYRPQRFAEVVGQEHVTQTLINAIRQNRIAHAYLFVGPRGTGKTTIARIFAKCLNCTGGPQVEFDEQDPRCQEISEGRSLDVLEIDGASNNGVDQVRELRETVKFAPANSRFRIYIIDEVHMLTTAAFNALLKTLEEPPAHVKFLFATTEPDKVLPTILSRCQRFDLRRIPIPLIVKQLAYITQREQAQADEAALHAIARGADGCLRDAESTLDQLISFCGRQISEADVLSMFGLAARAQIQALTGAMLAGDLHAVLRHVDELARGGKDLGRLLSDLLNHFRNLLLYHVSSGDLALIEVSEAEAATLKTQARAVSVEALTRLLEVLTDTEGQFRFAASKRILIEVGLLKAVEARHAVNLDAVLKQLQQWRADAPGATAPAWRETAPPVPGPTPAPVPVPAPPPRPAPANAAPVLPTAAPAAAAAPENPLQVMWAHVSDAVRKASLFLGSYLAQTRPLSLENGRLTVEFDPGLADQMEFMDNPKNRELVQAKLKLVTGQDLKLVFVKHAGPASAPVPAAPAAPPTPETAAPASPRPSDPPAKPAPKAPASTESAAAQEAFKNDPLIQQALADFKARIIEFSA